MWFKWLLYTWNNPVNLEINQNDRIEFKINDFDRKLHK